MERVLSLSWQWVRNWVPPCLTAIALVASMVGLWMILFESSSVVEASASARQAASIATREQQADRQAQPVSVAATPTSESEVATPAAATECQGLQEEIDSVSVRARGSGKSRQVARARVRLRELKDLYQEECVLPIAARASRSGNEPR